jgi:membrane-associated phospholipid phosphatase
MTPITAVGISGSAIPGTRAPKATAADLGLNGLARRLIGLQLVVILATGLLMRYQQLVIAGWSGKGLALANVVILLGVWLYFFAMPGPRGGGEERIAETFLIFVLLIVFTAVSAVAQYPAVAMGAPYADGWLARSDAAIGVNVAALANVVSRHPATAHLLRQAYLAYIPQFFFTVIGLAILGDRKHLWELVFHHHVCLTLAVIGLACWPAVCPPAYYGFVPTIDMTRLIHQIRSLHDGTMKVVRLDELDGLVSFPSFHVAGAMMIAWAWRRRLWTLIPIVVLNTAVIVSTFVTGVHYFVDVVAAVPLVAGSIIAFRYYGQPLLEGSPGPAGAPLDVAGGRTPQ